MIADVCFKAGYIDSWGRGTIKIMEACEQAGLPEPVLREEQGGFLSEVIKVVAKSPNAIRENQLAYGRTAEEIRKNCGRNRIGSTKSGYWKVNT